MTTYILCGVSVALILIFLLLTWAKFKRINRRAKSCDLLKMPDDDKFPSVSVIVHDDSRAWNLAELLPRILEQDYPAPIEVIIVNDGMRHESEMALATLEGRYPNVYMTFLPEGSRSLSRRKLAVMLGVKAARYESIILLGGNCMIDSPMWLKAMMRHFVKGKELVIGWGYPSPRKFNDAPAKRLSRLATFDLLRTAVQYLSWAIAGKPWRANPYNMAFTSRLFYANRGFAETLNLVRGDDDLWVKQVATKENTAVELSADSMVEILEDNTIDSFKADKLSHEFTSSKPGRSARLTFSLASWCWWLSFLSGVAAIVSGGLTIWPLVALTVVALAVCIPLMLRWKRTARRLHLRPLCLTVIWFMFLHPFYSLYYKIKSRRHRRHNFTAGSLR